MAARRVMSCKIDSSGDVIYLCNPGEQWSPRKKDEVIGDIENNLHNYYIQTLEGEKTNLRIIEGISGKYLRSTHDSRSPNNLGNLPECYVSHGDLVP